MISVGLILTSAVLTGLAVALAGWRVRWPAPDIAGASIGATVAVVLWRLIANAAAWNGDFLPLVSLGDTGCIMAGAVAPAIVAARRPTAPYRCVPAAVGAAAAFAINVIIL